jgi:carbonic anhydrase
MTLVRDLLRAKAQHVARFDESELHVRPRRALAIPTCMDSRYTAQGVTGLALGDAHVIRNAGGRATEDAIRSLTLSAAILGTRACAVIHHTDCGLLGRSDAELQARVADAAGATPTFSFLPFHDLDPSVRDDVRVQCPCYSLWRVGDLACPFQTRVCCGRLPEFPAPMPLVPTKRRPRALLADKAST